MATQNKEEYIKIESDDKTMSISCSMSRSLVAYIDALNHEPLYHVNTCNIAYQSSDPQS